MKLSNQTLRTQCPPGNRSLVLAALCLAIVSGWELLPARGQTSGTIEIEFVDEKSDENLPCRVKVLDSRGRPITPRKALTESGWSLIEDTMIVRGRPGDYTYRAYHGYEYAAGSGGFTLDKKSEGYDLLLLPRHANLLDESWIGGDLASQVAPASSLRWLPAEGLHMAAVPSQRSAAKTPDEGELLVRRSKNGSRWVEDASYHDQRDGSGIVLHHWLPPAEVPVELPSSRLLVISKQNSGMSTVDALPTHAEITRLWARDTPIWLASNRIDSIQILGPHLTLDGDAPSKSLPRIESGSVLEFDGLFGTSRTNDERGLGRFVEFLYWQVLEAGLRIPPSAGSGFGETKSPLGYNRVYASVGSGTRADWWQSLRAGRTFVTNGPLLRTTVNGEQPGAVFSGEEGASIGLDVALTLTVADPVEYLDVIFNGRTLYQARLSEYAKQGGKIPPLSVDESGWLVVRVVTEREHTYRIATTAPYFVEIGGRPRVSRKAVEFFLTWLEESAEKIAQSSQATASKPYVEAARQFWNEQLARSTEAEPAQADSSANP